MVVEPKEFGSYLSGWVFRKFTGKSKIVMKDTPLFSLGPFFFLLVEIAFYSTARVIAGDAQDREGVGGRRNQKGPWSTLHERLKGATNTRLPLLTVLFAPRSKWYRYFALSRPDGLLGT